MYIFRIRVNRIRKLKVSNESNGKIKDLNPEEIKNIFEPLDQKEKDLMESIERNEWVSVDNLEDEKKKSMMAARNTL